MGFRQSLKGAGSMSPSSIIGVFVMIVIGASLVGPLADIIASPGGNVTGATLVLYGLLTLFFVIIIIVAVVKVIDR